VPRFRIRYQGTDLEMPPGEFVVGRSSSCHLALDDALVSRRHATIHVQEGGAWVEDLGSRNGVSVNGERVEGRRKLNHLDRVTIGSHELVLVEVPDRAQKTVPCETCGAPVGPDMQFCQKCGHPITRGSPTLAGMTLEIPSDKVEALKTVKKADATRPVQIGVEESTGRALLTNIADKALALGRFDEAERVLGKTLQEILARAKQGQPPSVSRITEGTKYALKLAEGTKRTSWLDWVFELHEATGRLMSADEIERIHDLVRKLRYHGVGPVRRYVDAMRAKAGELGAAERFLLSRLEGIERMVSA
jgi:hypothetical protein